MKMRFRASLRAGAILGLMACIAVWPLPAQEESEIRVEKHGVGTAVIDRELEGETDRFEEGEQAWFWTLVVEGRDGDRINHVWLHEGEEKVSVGLSIGGPRWRTYTRKKLYAGSAGSWVVEARALDGRVLARQEFTCEVAGGDEDN